MVVVATLGGTVLGMAVALVNGPKGPVYTVAQVSAGLRQHPAAWVGRTVVVRGTLAVAEGQNWNNGVVNGMWWSSWPVAGTSLGFPTGAPLHIIEARVKGADVRVALLEDLIRRLRLIDDYININDPGGAGRS
jgi:hypothetical protein